MKKTILLLGAVCILLSGCSPSPGAAQNAPGTIASAMDNVSAMSLESDSKALPDALSGTYYLPSDDPVYSYLQNKSIKRFFNMWLNDYMGEDIEAQWNYDTLAPVRLLDHDFKSVARSGDTFYTCTFTTDDDRCGYIIVSYREGKEGPYISKWSLHETTPYLYDLAANSEQIAAALKETDIDLASASAARVELIDTDKNRGDRIILFTDGTDSHYVCYLGGDDFTIEKQ